MNLMEIAKLGNVEKVSYTSNEDNYVNIFINKVIKCGRFNVFMPLGETVPITLKLNMKEVGDTLELLPSDIMQTLCDKFDDIVSSYQSEGRSYSLESFFTQAESMGLMEFEPYVNDGALVSSWCEFISYNPSAGYLLKATASDSSGVPITDPLIQEAENILMQHDVNFASMRDGLAVLSLIKFCAKNSSYRIYLNEYREALDSLIFPIKTINYFSSGSSARCTWEKEYKPNDLQEYRSYCVSDYEGTPYARFSVLPNFQVNITYQEKSGLMNRTFTFPIHIDASEFNSIEVTTLNRVLVSMALYLCDIYVGCDFQRVLPIVPMNRYYGGDDIEFNSIEDIL